jgi:hypothetical protein
MPKVVTITLAPGFASLSTSGKSGPICHKQNLLKEILHEPPSSLWRILKFVPLMAKK